jgi:hypothetical protein
VFMRIERPTLHRSSRPTPGLVGMHGSSEPSCFRASSRQAGAQVTVDKYARSERLEAASTCAAWDDLQASPPQVAVLSVRPAGASVSRSPGRHARSSSVAGASQTGTRALALARKRALCSATLCPRGSRGRRPGRALVVARCGSESVVASSPALLATEVRGQRAECAMDAGGGPRVLPGGLGRRPARGAARGNASGSGAAWHSNVCGGMLTSRMPRE